MCPDSAEFLGGAQLGVICVISLESKADMQEAEKVTLVDQRHEHL